MPETEGEFGELVIIFGKPTRGQQRKITAARAAGRKLAVVHAPPRRTWWQRLWRRS